MSLGIYTSVVLLARCTYSSGGLGTWLDAHSTAGVTHAGSLPVTRCVLAGIHVCMHGLGIIIGGTHTHIYKRILTESNL